MARFRFRFKTETRKRSGREADRDLRRRSGPARLEWFRVQPVEGLPETIDDGRLDRSIFGDIENSPATTSVAGAQFVLADNGEIVTNAHVISDGSGDDHKAADEVYVEFSSGDVCLTPRSSDSIPSPTSVCSRSPTDKSR